ncbi:hypothetical protein JCM11641_004864 [Rhodosporidiobolus odoratus]
MRFRLPRVQLPVTPRSPSFFHPSYRNLNLASDTLSASRRFSYSSNSGRSSSRDGSERAKPSPDSSNSASPTSSRSPSSAAPQRPCAPTAPAVPKHTSAGARDRFVIPHANWELVGADSFFATHRPLLELPVRLGNRRTTRLSSLPVLPGPDAELSVDKVLEAQGKTIQLEEDLGSNVARVVDLAEDGTPMGAPYLVRLDAPEPLRSVEEELAAEAKEEAELQQKVEELHEQEAESVEPYEAWMIGQHQVQSSAIARYLAVHPPFSSPSESSPSSSTPSSSSSLPRLPSQLAFLAPFRNAGPTSSSSAFPAFTDHFVTPLDPQESSARADQFLSSAQMKQGWAARSDYVREAAESLRQAAQTYAGVDEATQAQFPLPHAAGRQQAERGSVKLWDEQEGWTTVKLAQHGLGQSVFLPAELVEDVDISMDSVRRKRKKAMLKHKYKKRRKAQRALRQRLGK